MNILSSSFIIEYKQQQQHLLLLYFLSLLLLFEKVVVVHSFSITTTTSARRTTSSYSYTTTSRTTSRIVNNNNNNNNINIIMNSALSINDDELVIVDDVNNNSLLQEKKKLSKNQQKKLKKIAKVEKWKKHVQDFIEQVLDPSYLGGYPVRATTIDAASQYISNNNNQQCTLMPGSHKHLGGAYDKTDGCIYGVPANSRSVLCLYPNNNNDNDNTTLYNMKTIPLPESICDTTYKWLRGIFAHGYLWAIPSWANAVLCVDIDQLWGRRREVESTNNNSNSNNNNNVIQLISLPDEHIRSTWQWHGAGINHEQTAIYCIPSNAKHVLKVDLITKTTSLINIQYDQQKYTNFNINSTNKWYGGIVGKDNCVYGIPYGSCAILQINCNTDTATLIGPDYGNTKYYWHGGIQVHGKIYAHPSHANTVLVINTNPNAEQICYEIPINFNKSSKDNDINKNYKWLGGAIGSDGNIYCPACDTSAVLKINTITEQCTTFGYAGTDRNKWQGGVLGRDGCIYCIPASGRHVLRIATDPKIIDNNNNNNKNPPPIQLLGNLPDHKDKWQGGYNGIDGCLYFIPENGYRVLKITPPTIPPEIVNGKLPDNDVTLEML